LLSFLLLTGQGGAGENILPKNNLDHITYLTVPPLVLTKHSLILFSPNVSPALIFLAVPDA
jgi:hypothetical protein